MILERGIEVGLEQNLLVYDAEAQKNILTKRLLVLVKTVGLRNLNTVFDRIYLPLESKADVIEWLPNDYLFNDFEHVLFLGIQLHFIESLGENQILQRFFEELGGSYAYEDKSLGIATNSNQFLLMSY